MAPRRLSPSGVSAYSTRGGTTGYTVPLELTHGQGQHALADPVDLASQLGEAPRAAPEQLDHEQRPLVGQAVEQVPNLARLGRLHGRRADPGIAAVTE